MDDSYGPALPPEMCGASNNDNERIPVASTLSNAPRSIGPSLPPGFQRSDSPTHSKDSSIDSDSEEEQQPAKESAEDENFIGPVIPANVTIPKDESSESESSDEEYVIGPLPSLASSGDNTAYAAAEIEKREMRMKEKLKKSDEKPLKREEWMMSLPTDRKHDLGLGLTARTFRTDAGAKLEIDNSWTDTPNQGGQKNDDSGKSQKRKYAVSSTRDKDMKQMVEEHNKKRKTKSLLDLHQEKIHGKTKKKKEKHKKKDKKKKDKKSKKEKEKEKPERRPFDRELDLKVNQFDDAMRKSYIKKAQGLGGNFKHGGQQFL